LITNTSVASNNLKSFTNISAVKTEEFRKLNIIDALNYKYLVIINPQASIEALSAKLT